MKNLPESPSYSQPAHDTSWKAPALFHFSLFCGNQLRSNQPDCSMRFISQDTNSLPPWWVVIRNLRLDGKSCHFSSPPSPWLHTFTCLRSSIFSRLFFLKTFMKHKPYQNIRHQEISLTPASRRRNSFSRWVSLSRENGDDQVKSNKMIVRRRGRFYRQETRYEKLQ